MTYECVAINDFLPKPRLALSNVYNVHRLKCSNRYAIFYLESRKSLTHDSAKWQVAERV